MLVALGGILAWVERDGGSGAAAPTAAEVRRIHAALHAVGATCARGRLDARDRRRLVVAARLFARFAGTYPRVAFRVDGEDAGAISLLLVAREAVRGCWPPAAAIVDRALPAKLRTSG